MWFATCVLILLPQCNWLNSLLTSLCLFYTPPEILCCFSDPSSYDESVSQGVKQDAGLNCQLIICDVSILKSHRDAYQDLNKWVLIICLSSIRVTAGSRGGKIISVEKKCWFLYLLKIIYLIYYRLQTLVDLLFRYSKIIKKSKILWSVNCLKPLYIWTKKTNKQF